MNLMIFPMIVKWEKELEMKRQANPMPGAESGLTNWTARPSRKNRKSSYGLADPHCPCEAPVTDCHL